MIRRVGMAPRRQGLSPGQFQEHWRTSHGDVAGQIPGVRSYVQNHAVLVDGRPVLAYPGFDACSELEFDDVATMDAGFASPHYQRAVRADEDAFVDKSRFCLLLAQADVVQDRTPSPDDVKLLTFCRAHPAVDRPLLAQTLAGPYAEAAVRNGAGRVELLTAIDEERPGRERAACDAVLSAWFGSTEAALDHVHSDAGLSIAGLTFGTERLLARTVRIV